MTPARAQATAAASPDKWCMEFAAAATLGHASASSFGVEIDRTVTSSWGLILEAGQMRNVATSDLDRRAQIIANFYGAGVGASQRAIYVDAGIKYQVPFGIWHPYAMVGAGAARVTTNTVFTLEGTDVTARLTDQYGLLLGTDLSGTLTKPFLTAGGGFSVPWGRRYLVDVSYRYGRIFPKTSAIENDTSVNTQRVQAAIGVRF